MVWYPMKCWITSTVHSNKVGAKPAGAHSEHLILAVLCCAHEFITLIIRAITPSDRTTSADEKDDDD